MLSDQVNIRSKLLPEIKSSIHNNKGVNSYRGHKKSKTLMPLITKLQNTMQKRDRTARRNRQSAITVGDSTFSQHLIDLSRQKITKDMEDLNNT